MLSVAAAPASANAPASEISASEQRKVNAICRFAFLAATAVSMCVPARGPLVLAMLKGDAAATGKIMGAMSTGAATIEFALNPGLGRLSDKYGRKPFILFATSVCAFLHSLVWAYPGSLPIMKLDRIISGAMIFCIANPVGAALQDLFSEKLMNLGSALPKLAAHFGIGFALGPLLGSRLGGRQAFGVSAALFAAGAASVYTGFEETLQEERVKQFEISAANPFSFVRLFSTKAMAQLSVVQAFSSFADYANINDINFLFMNQVMGYGQKEVGLFAAGFGCTQIAGGLLNQHIIKSLGLKSSTIFSNMAYFVGFGLLGTARGFRQVALALFCFSWGHGRGFYPGSLMQGHAREAGMGNGEIQGVQANFMAVLKIIVPTFYGRLFAWATSGGRNMPGLPYYAVCMFIAASQMVFSSHLMLFDVEDEKKTV